MEDVHYFTDICRRRGQKPVPYILAFDSDFLVSFKKDPLWQVEDLESTYHADAGRVCILSGPVAVQHCKEGNIPVARFLEGIHSGYREKEVAFGEPAVTHPWRLPL